MRNLSLAFFFLGGAALCQPVPPIRDKAGNEIPPIKLEYAGHIIGDTVRSNIWLLYSIDKKIGFYDRTGREVVPPTFERADVITLPGREPVIKVTRMDDNGVFQVGVLDLRGNLIVPSIYSAIDPMGTGTTFQALSTPGENQGVLMEYSKVIIAAQYAEINVVEASGRTLFNVVDNKTEVALMDSLGRTILPFGYSNYDMYPDENSPAPGPVYFQFVHRKKYGYAATEKGIVIPALYKYTESWNLGGKIYFPLERGKKKGVADGEGRWVVPMAYGRIDYEEFPGKVYFIVKQKKKFGIIDERGELLVPIEYRSIESMGGGNTVGLFSMVNQNGQTFLLTQEHKLVKTVE